MFWFSFQRNVSLFRLLRKVSQGLRVRKAISVNPFKKIKNVGEIPYERSLIFPPLLLKDWSSPVLKSLLNPFLFLTFMDLCLNNVFVFVTYHFLRHSKPPRQRTNLTISSIWIYHSSWDNVTKSWLCLFSCNFAVRVEF